jgi:FtsZ-interacting cell division protein ZipA
METRSIAIGLIAVVAAFAAAFGLAKSGGSKTATAGAGVKAQSINVAAPPAVAGVAVGGTVPALKTVHRAPAKKKAKKPSSSSTSSASTTNASTQNTTQQKASTNNTSTQNTTTQQPVQHQTTTVQKQAPVQKKAPVQHQQPVVSNDETG